MSIPTEAAQRSSDSASFKRKGVLPVTWDENVGFFSDTFRAFPFKIVVYLKILKAKKKEKSRNFSATSSRTFLAPISGHLPPPSGQW